uniref:Microtubule actin crosslinking factor 1 n=1 Tax=Pseudonaja textilis TaxID=8673 RepID=A0A670ZXR1_PSETE
MAGYVPGQLPLNRSQEKEFVQAYEDVLERYKDERDRVQKKTFTKWVNKHLMKVRKHINDLYEDLRDGHNLISLLEVLSGVKLPREKGRMRFHRLQNVQIALDFLKQRQVKLVNIRNDDITDGNPKLTLGLIWTIILHFQISDIYISGESGDMSAKEKLLLWSQKVTAGYVGLKCTNFSSCWSDGKMFNAVIHRYRPDLVDMERVYLQSNQENLEQAFEIAERLGVTRLLDSEDVDVPSPDEKSVITYVSSIYDAFPKVPEGGEGISATEVDTKWLEYQTCVETLISWIKQHTIQMSDKSFPQNPVKLKALYNQYIHFKETEIPTKQLEKRSIEELYKLLEVWIEFGRLKLPQGYHPNNVEEEWGKLIIEMLEREKLLRPAVERLELLLQRANKIQNGTLSCEEKLTLARNTLQADEAHLESGQPVQYESDVVMYLQECEGLLRQLQADVQILRDENYYQLEELVFKIVRLQDELVTLRLECTNLYRKGHFSSPSSLDLAQPSSLSTRQVKTEPLLKGTIAPPASASWIRKPMTRMELVSISSSEDEGSLRFVYELLSWVEELQVRYMLERSEWGNDLPTVEAQLEVQRQVHSSVEGTGSSVKEARINHLNIMKWDKMCHLFMQETSSFRLRHLQSLYEFVSQATTELIWLNEKEEEELAYDWSENNPNLTTKKNYFSELTEELEEKQDVFRALQDSAELLSLENHPAKQTVEAYSAAVQTQWHWIKQLCLCVDQHLRENTAYFQFFGDARESEMFLKNLQDNIKRKYSCDRNTSLTRLEDLLQDSMDEKEQLIQSKSSVGSLVGRSKSIVQLKPRNPESPLKSTISVKAACDYHQIEITICRNDECVLKDNAQRTKWKVISPAGNEATVPSVCFLVPPPNREAIEMASRVEQLYQKVMSLWHQLHVNMKSLVSWNYLRKDIALVQIKLKCHHVVKNLQVHFEDFLEDSRDSEIFSLADRLHLEEEVDACKENFQRLLQSMENEDKDETASRTYLSELKNIRLHLEECEQRLVGTIRTPSSTRTDGDALQENTFRMAEQERLKGDLHQLRVDLDQLAERCHIFLHKSPTGSSTPQLRTELNLLVEKMDQVYGLSAVYLDKLKMVDVIIQNTQGAESLVKGYEVKLSQEEAVPADIIAIQSHRVSLQHWISEVNTKSAVFATLEDDLARAKGVADQLYRLKQERSLDLEHYQEKGAQLWDRWQRVNLKSELENIEDVLRDYRNCHGALVQWIEQTTAQQELMKPGQAEDSRVLSEQLSQQMDPDYCSSRILFVLLPSQEYELQLMTYRAFVESQQKSPVKRRRVLSSSDAITQEFMDLRTHYTALVTLTTQHVKYISDALRRLEEEEVRTEFAHYSCDSDFFSLFPPPAPLSQGNEAIAGVLDLGTMEVFSIFDAMQKGLLDQETGLLLLEVQVVTAGLVVPSVSEKLSLAECLTTDEINGKIYQHLEEMQDAVQLIQNMQVKDSPFHPVVAAIKNGIISENTGLKIAQVQLLTGNFIDPSSHEQIGLEDALQKGIITNHFHEKLVNGLKSCEEALTDPNSAEKISFRDLLQQCVPHQETGLKLFPLKQEASGGMLSLQSGPEAAVLSAVHEGLVEKEGTMALLGAHLFAGGLEDPERDSQLTVEEAGRHHLIKQELVCDLVRQLQTGGILDPLTGERLSLQKAVEGGLVTSRLAVMILESLRSFVGLVRPESGEIVSVTDSLEQGILTSELADKILRGRQNITALFEAETNEILPWKRAVDCGILNKDVAKTLKSTCLPDFIPGMPLSGPSSSFQRRSSSSAQPAGHGAENKDPLRSCEERMLLYLMTHSYVNIHNGEKLLLVDEELNSLSEILVPAKGNGSSIDPLEAGKILSLASALEKEVLDEDTAKTIAINQILAGGIVTAESGKRVTLKEATEKGLITPKLARAIQEPDLEERKGPEPQRLLQNDAIHTFPSNEEPVMPPEATDSSASASAGIASLEAGGKTERDGSSPPPASTVPTVDSSVSQFLEENKLAPELAFMLDPAEGLRIKTQKKNSKKKNKLRKKEPFKGEPERQTRSNPEAEKILEGTFPVDSSTINRDQEQKENVVQPEESACVAFGPEMANRTLCIESVASKELSSIIQQEKEDDGRHLQGSTKIVSKKQADNTFLGDAKMELPSQGSELKAHELSILESVDSKTIKKKKAKKIKKQSASSSNSRDATMTRKIKGELIPSSVESLQENPSGGVTSPLEPGEVKSQDPDQVGRKEKQYVGTEESIIGDQKTNIAPKRDATEEVSVQKAGLYRDSSIDTIEKQILLKKKQKHFSSEEQVPKHTESFGSSESQPEDLQNRKNLEDKLSSYSSVTSFIQEETGVKEVSGKDENIIHKELSMSSEAEESGQESDIIGPEGQMLPDREFPESKRDSSEKLCMQQESAEIREVGNVDYSSCMVENTEEKCQDASTSTKVGNLNLMVAHAYLELTKPLTETKSQLDETASNTQFFISEHVQDLSPEQSGQLLRLLNDLQRSFRELLERVTPHTEVLQVCLQPVELMEEMTGWTSFFWAALSLIGSSVVVGSLVVLQDLCRSLHSRTASFTSILKATEDFLEENRIKLPLGELESLQEKLHQAQGQYLSLQERLEAAQKELESAVSSVVQQQTEKVGHFLLMFSFQVHHQELLSHQQDVILATQSAQGFLDRHNHNLTLEEKQDLQRRLGELKDQYAASLSQTEGQLKQVQALRDELQKFLRDHQEFAAWLEQAEQDLEKMCAGDGSLESLQPVLLQQSSFSEDVISHKGDLRFVTMSGQKVLDAETAVAAARGGELCPEISATRTLVESKLEDASRRYGTLHSKCSALGLHLNLLLDRSRQFQDVAESLRSWLQESEEAVTLLLVEPISSDPAILQRQLANTKVSQQVHLLLGFNLLQTFYLIQGSSSPRRQAALLSPICASFLLQKLKQDIARQKSSLEATREMVTRFMESADSTTAAALQTKLADVTQRFSHLWQQQQEKEDTWKKILPQVEQYEQLSEKLKQFLESRGRMLALGNQPEQDIVHFAQQIQELNSEMTQRHEDLDNLEHLTTELSSCGLVWTGFSSHQEKVHSLRKEFTQLEKGASSCQEQLDVFRKLVGSLRQWLEETERNIPAPETSLGTQELEKRRQQTEVGRGERRPEAFLGDLEQNAVKVQAAKESLSGLLKKYPDSPEARNWKRMLEDLSTWANAKQVTEERQQKLEKSANELASFQEAEGQLRPWLMEKELMMSVLGPLSIDPNMLNAQKQQVQFMLKEFEARKHQYDQLNEAARGIPTSPGETSPPHSHVQEELQAINRKWTKLTERLNSRSSQIDQAVVKSTQFQELLQGLSEKVKAAGQRLSTQPAISTQPEAVKQQLEETSEIRSELEQLEEEITEAQALCEQLSVLMGEQYLKDELRKRLETVALPLKGLEDLAGDRLNRLQTALASSQQFQQMFDELHTWLEDRLKQQAESGPISARLERLQCQIQEQEESQKSLNQHSGSYEMIVAEEESLLLSVHPGEEKTTMQNQLVSLKANWEELSKQIASRHAKLKDCLQKAQKYQRHVEDLFPWVEDCRSKMLELEVTLDLVQLEAALLRSKAMLSDVAKRRSLLEMLNSAADVLIDASEMDEDDIRDEKAEINHKMDVITEELQAKTESLEEMSQRLKEFQESFRNIEKKLEGTKHQLEIYEALGPQACSNKNLEKLRAQQEALQALGAQVDYLRNFTQGLVEDTPDGSDSSHLLRQAEIVQQDFKGVKQKVNECCKIMENKLEGIGLFNNHVREMFSQLTDLDDELDSMGPVGRDMDSLQSQADDAQEFLGKLHQLRLDIQASEEKCRQMLDEEGSPDLIGLKRELETLNKQCIKLTERGKSRLEQVETTLARVKDFYNKLKELNYMTTAAEEGEALQWVVGTEVDVINQQLADFKVRQFQKEQVDPLQLKLQQVNGLGQGLVQSAGKNCDVQGLEHDMEEISTRWNTLNKKVAQRIAQLQEALLHCGKFQDALEPLLSWLADTEELISNQKPPSAEYKVVKAQIQEQKLLQRLLDDRKATVDMIQAEGDRIARSAEPADREKIVGQLTSLGSHWASLLSKASARQSQLEEILVLAKQFHETSEPISEWLSVTEKKLANSEPIGTQTAKIQQQIARHKALNDEIVNRKKHVDQAMKNGQALLKQTTGEEVLLIQEKLDGIKTRYSDITAASSKALRTLEQARQLATKFQSTHEELTGWMGQVEEELRSGGGPSPAGEQIPRFQQRQKELKKEVMEHQVILDTVNEVSHALLELVPWRAREGLDKLVSDANERYKATSDTINQRVAEIDAAIQRSQQYEQAADAELAWVAETRRKLLALGPVRLEQDQTTAQLQVQKAFSVDIIRHKDSVDELLSQRTEILGTCGEEQKVMLQKTESLLEQYEETSHLHSERYARLERAQVLVNQFWETYEELSPWLEETQVLIGQLPPPAIDHEHLKQQQEDMRQLRESIAEHKPHIDKLLKIGPQLTELNPEEGAMVQGKYFAAEAAYSHIKEEVHQRALALDEAISQSTQFHDKIEPMLETLESLSSRLRMPPLIPAEVEKIRECIGDNKNATLELEKLQPSFEGLKRRGEELIRRSQGADRDLAAKNIQDKLDQMVFFWEDIKARAEEREIKFLDVLELAEKFWYDMAALLTTIRDTQDIVHDLESPGIDPSIIKQQIEAAETIKEETDGLHEELEFIRILGADLIFACGETEKPEVKKSIDEMNSAWEQLNRTWKERLEKLEEAMQSAVQYQDNLQAMFDWLDNTVIKLCNMSPVGTDLNTVKEQLNEMKEFKTEVYQQQIEMEKLNHQGELLLKKATDETDRDIIREPLTELKHLWENLGEKIAHRQHKLEGSLLALGQFQHALAELMAWLTHTEELLDSQKAINGDPRVIEVELAKHHVLKNDVLAHQATVETVNKAGNELLESSARDDASSLRSRLETMNSCWESILQKTEVREQQLQATLQQAQGFHGEIESFLLWLTRMESQLSASKATGGLPETAREQLSTHMVSQGLGGGGFARVPVSASWGSKLEEALNLATEFQNSLQDFINWLTLAEQSLNVASPPSLIHSTVLSQVDEHKGFANEVNAHRHQIIALDQSGNQLKFLSQKQDVVLIKNLLVSVQSRWEKVVQRSVERGRALDDARKRAKQFHEAWRKLVDWLEDAENNLNSELEISNDPDKIKLQLSKHKEFQKTLGGKQPVYDTTIRTGRALKEKAHFPDDTQNLDHLLGEVRDKWDTVCGKSVERQHKLEEALLFSGQFMDALQALVDWLYKVEPQLAEDQPVHGDLDLVMNSMDAHKVFQKELGKRTGTVQVLKRSGRELIENSRDDTTWVKVQLQELSNRWDTVCKMSVLKQTRLEQALKQAEEFRTAIHQLLEWLSEAEQTLRFRGALPDDAEALQSLIDVHKEFMKKVEEKRLDVNSAVGMGEAILSVCHPDCVTTIKHWITIIRARFEEVLTWAKQHQQRLEAALLELRANAELLEELLAWIQWAEATLIQRDQEPQNIEQVKALIAEHQSFMEEMTRKQPDVDRVTKTYKRKVTEPTHGKPLNQAAPPPLPILLQAEAKNPRINQLSARWQQVWLLALERQRKLNDALDRLEELKEFANFDFDVWRKKYMRWMNHKKSRVMDFFRRIDKDQDGKITRQEFIDGILASKFPTTKLEMTAVADIFDRDGDGYIDYYEFVAALHPNKDAYRPTTDADKIEDEVTRQVAQCKCAKRFQVEQIGENKYRFFLGNQFGDSQQLRLVRILRSTVMVRVGGGWMALDEFLVKNDPCRVLALCRLLHSGPGGCVTCILCPFLTARGRTNLELREKFILPEGASQGMAPFRSRGRRSKPSSRAASPTRSSSSASQSNHSCPSVPSSPATPASGTKVRRRPFPGLFWRAKEKTASRPTSRAGSHAGSRTSSRRGSDASDFDLLETQSACSDTSESSATGGGGGGGGGQGGSRRGPAKPSKIPTMSKKTSTAKSPGPKR